METKNKKTLQITLTGKINDGAAFAPFLFGNTADEDKKAYEHGALDKAAAVAVEALIAQKPDKSVVSIDNISVKRGNQNLTVITLINDNKPFLLTSAMTYLTKRASSIYLLAHPIFDLKLENKTITLELKDAEYEENPEYRSVSVMQFHVNQLNQEQADLVQQDLSNILAQVDSAVHGWPLMLEETQKLINAYSAPTAGINATEAANAMAFLEWLKNNNFTYLGMRQYDFNKAENTLKPRGISLGILENKFVLSPNDAPNDAIYDADSNDVSQEILAFIEREAPLTVAKASARSVIQRPVWLDNIYVKLYDAKGTITGVIYITGIFRKSAYSTSIMQIPYLKEKANTVIKQLGFNKNDYSGKTLLTILESYPRTDLIRIDVKTLCEHARLILDLNERPRIRALSYIDPHSRFVSLLIYVPRDRFDSNIRNKIGAFLVETYDGDFFEYHPDFLSNGLTCIHYMVHRKKTAALLDIPREMLESQITHILSNWEDNVMETQVALKSTAAEIDYAIALPSSYRELFGAKSALYDASYILTLDAKKQIKAVFYHQAENGENGVSLKIFHYGEALLLSDRVPLLENMGFKVIAEQTLELAPKNGENSKIYLHNMQLQNAYNEVVDLTDGGQRLNEIFEMTWAKEAENDAFNALVQTAKLDWEKIIILRLYGQYLQQAGISYTQSRLAEALNRYPLIAQNLYGLFEFKFNPETRAKSSPQAEVHLQSEIESELQIVSNLDDDVIIRRFFNLIEASLRTNAYAPENDGSRRRTIAVKFNSSIIDNLPEPKPYREIFVYGPDVEGVHLRCGPVARGGIRWSDRAFDYRTEVLSLVKAQQVKNAVIVPSGSKGGFYPHNLPISDDRGVIAEAARLAYITYISAMLSITDNIVEGKVIRPRDVICHDDDDPYFVVAADKGTASFSDTANGVSAAYNFWLDDAFASGGSAGYSHKAMAITAKGAWEAVKRHFREIFDRDIQTEPFSTVGVGDMSGDVFGNGMLLSNKTRLIAAFDHRDIFIDPSPEPEKSHEERLRLFNLSRSSWQDYDRNKLSKGGEIYSRSQKIITLSPEAAEAIGFNKLTGTPTEIMAAILKAKVDLLWFGGIGTYIRGAGETDAQVSDRANDALRITGAEVRAAIIGEGANLGMTQRGRIEYSQNNGRCDTDAIDNSAGVNCSDLEVNIKIAFAAALHKGTLKLEARNQLLKEMTADVSKVVLRNNYLQSLALSLAQARGVRDLPYQMRFISELEQQNLLNRKVEVLPDDAALKSSLTMGQGLTRPELAIVMGYAKLILQDELASAKLADDPYFMDTLFNYFPLPMREKFADEIKAHRLRREIIITVLANDVVNRGGPTFVARLQDKTGASLETILQAYVCVRDGFETPALYDAIDALDNKISGSAQNGFYSTVMEMLFKTTNWILRNIDMNQPLEKLVSSIKQARLTIESDKETLFPDYLRVHLNDEASSFAALGAPADLAEKLSSLSVASIVPDIAYVAKTAQSNVAKTSKIYFGLSELLRLNKIEESGRAIPVIDYYDALALAEANNRIDAALRTMILEVIKDHGKSQTPVEDWLAARGVEVKKVIARMSALIEGDLNISRFTVAASMIASLVK